MSLQNQGEIYCLKSPSGKMYIGQALCILETKKLPYGTVGRWKGHCREANYDKKIGCVILNNAIRKYGQNSFQVITLLKCDINMLDYYESTMITLYNTLEPNGYNVRTGGSHGKHSKLSRQRMKISKLGKKIIIMENLEQRSQKKE